MKQHDDALDQRVKELRCLCDIASVVHTPHITRRESILEIVSLLPRGFRRPEAAGGNLAFPREEGLLLDAVAERLGNITENRQAEEALRLSEETFSKAFHA